MGEVSTTNQKFGRWTVLSVARTDKHVYLNCRCDCGVERVVNRESLRNGKSKSCGCLHREITKKQKNLKHGHSKTKLYAVWKTMRQRCFNKKNKGYVNYGGRGITICNEWQEFETFLSWAMANGYKNGLEIDRKDVDGNYCPNNCRWVTHFVNSNNRRSVFHYKHEGKIYNAKELSIHLGYSHSYISCMLSKGNKIKTIRKGKIIWQKIA